MRPRPKTAYQKKISVCLSVCLITFLSGYIRSDTLRMYVLTRCHVTDINHVLTRCHVTEINYVDRGVAAGTPLQYSIKKRIASTRGDTFLPLGHACFFCAS
jgi:hypothetical protein